MEVVFQREKAIDLVLLSLQKSYDLFIENFYMWNLNVNLIHWTHMLMVAKVEILKNTSEVEMLIGSDSKIFVQLGDVDIGGP